MRKVIKAINKVAISIIIRTKNEERWIGLCLETVFGQSYRDIEVAVIDNQSTDRTREKAQQFDVKLVTIDEYLPGKALNLGIRGTSGEIIVCLSGHCIPVNQHWLENLVRDLEDPEVAGVYGRQEPMSFTSDRDKRDLLTVFRLDRKVQVKDSFFHNANSAFRRLVWEEFPFDEEVSNIEDRVWGKEVTSAGYRIIYEPSASVYHHHGIHHDYDNERRSKIVRILESLELSDQSRTNARIPSPRVLAMVPVIGEPIICGRRPLLEYTLERATQAEKIDEVVVLTDNRGVVEIAEKAGAKVPFLRPRELSKEYVGLADILQYSLEKLEEMSFLPDVCMILEQTYPFRPPGFLDQLVERFVRGGMQSLMPVKGEYRAAWLKDEGTVKPISPVMPRNLKADQILVSRLGLGLVTYPKNIRDSSLGLHDVTMFEVSDPYALLEVRDTASLQLASSIIDDYWQR